MCSVRAIKPTLAECRTQMYAGALAHACANGGNLPAIGVILSRAALEQALTAELPCHWTHAGPAKHEMLRMLLIGRSALHFLQLLLHFVLLLLSVTAPHVVSFGSPSSFGKKLRCYQSTTNEPRKNFKRPAPQKSCGAGLFRGRSPSEDRSSTRGKETQTVNMGLTGVATAAHRQIQYDAVLESSAAHMQDRC